MRHALQAALFAAFAGLAVPAWAADKQPAAQEEAPVQLTVPGQVAQSVLPAFDLDGDGRIARGEFDRALDITFERWDTDSDTYLLPPDLPTPALQVYADRNNDGIVAYHEYLVPMLRLRDAIDTNGDKIVAAPEWRAFLEAQRVGPQMEGEAR